MTETYTASVLIKDLPRAADNIITALAALQNRNKWELVRDAMVEYAENHKAELARVAGVSK